MYHWVYLTVSRQIQFICYNTHSLQNSVWSKVLITQLLIRSSINRCLDIWLCSVPALLIRQIPVYSANLWIDSFAHTIYDVISQQSIKFITSMIQTYKYSIQVAQHKASFEKVNSGNTIAVSLYHFHAATGKNMLVVYSKPINETSLVI